MPDESVMSGDKALFLDLTDKVEDLLGPAHCKGRDHNVSVTVQGPLDDLREQEQTSDQGSAVHG